MIALIAAMDVEVAGVRRLWKARPVPAPSGLASCWGGRTIDGVPFVVAVSGIGQARAAAVTQELIEHYHPQAIISFGVAGALAPGWQLLDVALCTEIRNSDGESLNSPDDLSRAAADALAESGYAWRPAVSVTVDYIAETPEAKLRLYQETSADVVEMESFAVAKAAAEADIPFLCIRSVSDLDEQHLPNFGAFMRDNRIILWRLGLHVLRHPRDVDPLWHFYHVTRAASKQMAAVLAGIARHLASTSLPAAGASKLKAGS
jgi:nucleoside phosphorylase